jgi:uncharacterized SAM-binding protein YcdF (DUF218 family)
MSAGQARAVGEGVAAERSAASSSPEINASREDAAGEHNPTSPTFPGKKSRWLMLCLLLGSALIVFMALRNCGSYLIVDNGRKSDVILVPVGRLQPGYEKAFDLLRSGYGNHIIAEVVAVKQFGRPAPDLAQEYFAQQSDLNGKIDVCVIRITATESSQAAECISRLKPRSVLIVTNEFQTRRALKAFSHDLPQYQWSVTPVQPARPRPLKWWKNRRLAMVIYLEWCRLLWWDLFGE